MVMVTVALTAVDPLMVALTAGQVASVIFDGSVQVMFTVPVNPFAGVRVTVAVPVPPGDEIVTVGIDGIVKLEPIVICGALLDDWLE